MAGRRVYGGSEMTVLLQNDDRFNFEALLSSSSSSHAPGFNGSRSMFNFEEACGGSINQHLYRTRELEEAEDDFNEGLHQPEKKRRLTANQVLFLEKSFEVENKLEPERKFQLAKDIGLQPRQVAIWFQNRRARWKTKQLEKDYETLKSSYNVLKVDYDNLLKEKEKLKAEVVHVKDKLLLKENFNGITEELELKIPCHDFSVDDRKSESQLVGVIKVEDQSAANSAVSDSESPRLIDGARTDSSNAFEPDQSDISHVEEEEVRGFHQFLKLEDHSGGFDFPVEEHAFWLWP